MPWGVRSNRSSLCCSHILISVASPPLHFTLLKDSHYKCIISCSAVLRCFFKAYAYLYAILFFGGDGGGKVKVSGLVRPDDLAHSYKITSFNAILIKEIIPTLKKNKATLLYRSKFNICLRQTVMSQCNLGLGWDGVERCLFCSMHVDETM